MKAAIDALKSMPVSTQGDEAAKVVAIAVLEAIGDFFADVKRIADVLDKKPQEGRKFFKAKD